jgi:DNA-binding transcriptional regulator YiaG
MANIATVLKSEISRVARKEVRSESLNLKKASAQYRSDIAALKRRVLALEAEIKRLGKAAKTKTVAVATEDSSSRHRFSAKGFSSQRRRLGLTAVQMALLLGVSDQSVRKWEDGKSHPRVSQLPAIAAVRTMGKSQAAARLSVLSG